MRAATHRVHVFKRITGGIEQFPFELLRGHVLTINPERGDPVTITADRKMTIKNEAALLALLNPMFPCTFRKGDVVELASGSDQRFTMGVSRRFENTADFKEWMDSAQYTLTTGRTK